MEDKSYIDTFKQYYGEDKIIIFDREYIDYRGEGYVPTYSSDRPNDRRLKGEEYLISMLLLTKCNGLITSITAGSAGALYLSKEYDYYYVFDLGMY